MEKTVNSDETLDLYQAADFLRMSPSALRYKAKQGLILGAKPAKRWVFLKADLVSYLKSLYPSHGQAPLSAISEIEICHSTNAATRGGSGSLHPVGNEYAALLGLETVKRPRSTTINSRRPTGKPND
jgi:hypothetical protein